MRQIRIALAAAALAALVAAPAAAAQSPAAVTFHGTFTSGEAYSTALPGQLIFVIEPLDGVWSLNVNLAQSTANAVLLVRSPLDPPRHDAYPPKGLHARWTPAELDLAPVVEPITDSVILAVFPELAGRTYDPAHGAYLYTTFTPEMSALLIVSYDASTGDFFYLAVPSGWGCTTADGPWCFDSPKVLGEGRA